METPRKGKHTGAPVTYESSFKIAVAREYLEGNLSQSQLGRKHGLKSGEVVRYFVNWYKKNIAQIHSGLISPDSELPPLASSSPDEQLQEELRLARLKITALEMMIHIAEQELDIDIRKKSGTKPPVK
ncbi:transposase [Sphingobacterium sp. SRCM116780]|uniref:transposase n=1 Tax=Sphingobacterium sp. SRCM116780 TaxID=2907623 RepID=UPI001F4137FE|nr:transposase [Sphingobacterium sp. SRCM116780]UIR54710.1 transposase [Sphingobacterium sp. SRCM116780]UIR55218.1 transposase [Sphingobacterium sp. SRCM116780]UIR55728.1 transposase [Sphingobacterium sp. SRCM116780]UIR55843.1 transposase [Sphingobacterium sp. SRCM116780]UIR56017.1 transposase [Sphingobacterium sp. SRCM116780]